MTRVLILGSTGSIGVQALDVVDRADDLVACGLSCGTRREEMLLDPEEHRRVCILRRVLNGMNPADAMELMVSRLQKTKSNAEFLMSMNMK